MYGVQTNRFYKPDTTPVSSLLCLIPWFYQPFCAFGVIILWEVE